MVWERKVHPTSSPFHLSGGAFAAPKDLDRDRFIGDRRPQNCYGDGRDLRRILGLCVYALSFRREALSVRDVACVAAECFRNDDVVPSKVPYSRNCMLLLSSPHSWTQTFGPSHIFNSSRQTPVLQAPVLVRRLCLWNSGPVSTIFSDEKGCSVRLDWK